MLNEPYRAIINSFGSSVWHWCYQMKCNIIHVVCKHFVCSILYLSYQPTSCWTWRVMSLALRIFCRTHVDIQRKETCCLCVKHEMYSTQNDLKQQWWLQTLCKLESNPRVLTLESRVMHGWIVGRWWLLTKWMKIDKWTKAGQKRDTPW